MPLSNFGILTPFVMRSAQPDADAWTTLDSLRVRCVIKLNEETEYPHAKEALEAGSTVVVASGFEIDQWHPDDGKIRRCAALLNQNEGVTLVHCTHGRDRTGLIVGAWRLLYCNWSFEQVQSERERYGVAGIIEFADHEITEYLRRLAAEVRKG